MFFSFVNIFGWESVTFALFQGKNVSCTNQGGKKGFRLTVVFLFVGNIVFDNASNLVNFKVFTYFLLLGKSSLYFCVSSSLQNPKPLKWQKKEQVEIFCTQSARIPPLQPWVYIFFSFPFFVCAFSCNFTVCACVLQKLPFSFATRKRQRNQTQMKNPYLMHFLKARVLL